ncbi:MAG: transketolase [Deltaproteobacteria bacterium]|nr:MAG: transketolase [Deltaproteobacteria bacterium]
MSARAHRPARPTDPHTLDLLEKTIKGLAMDAVEAAGCGHPGMPMGMARPASNLWARFLVVDPQDPSWPDRDRFVLSAGHGSMLLYALLHLHGFDLSLDDIRAFRQWGSRTPGHPEFGETPGVEVTTGPLGTGFAAGVGMALAERFLAARYNRPGHVVVDHFTYGIVSDGDLMEGVAAEAASFAGHQGLGKLVYLYDDNRISIDGPTSLAFSEDVPARFRAYGWHVEVVDGYDDAAVTAAIEAARRHLEQPSLIVCRTEIGHGSPHKAGTAAVHGAKLGEDEVRATKEAMGWPLDPFYVPEELGAYAAAARAEGEAAHGRWREAMAAYRAEHPELAAEFEAVLAGDLPDGIFDDLPTFAPGEKIATRKAGKKVLSVLGARHPTLLGGSADLTDSNGVGLPDEPAASPQSPAGRNVHFGVREHAMAGICNGLALHGGVRPYDATFLVFSDFMRGCLRLSALMGLPVIHVFSHDSFLLGEDGPTHQPVEHLWSLRAIPGLDVVRPADANETVGAFAHALGRRLGDGPTAVCLTRQGVPVLEGSSRDVSRGAYVLWEPEGGATCGVLVATGSEVALALEAARLLLREHGRRVRVVSAPCLEAFDRQDEAYRRSVLPDDLRPRLAVEAGVTLGWARYADAAVGLDRFGASAPAGVLAEKFGFTAAAVAARFLELSAAAQGA